ncbi:zinc finger MYM-type protein 1-like [Vanessa cardui]|uniref:zinc finger MYM-type protein 1-like n=1 Tax=Vanessa cardui TaxID=171605 RepID=UPI001F1441C4|nr:zinc finger MYM-type protein 1-like [Vanessa cardui]
MDGKKRVRLSGAEYRKRAKEKDDKQKDTIKKTRKLDDFFGKPSTDIKDPTIEPTLDVHSSSGAPSTDDSAVSSSENTLVDVASISKKQAEDVPLVPGVGVQPSPPDKELYEISDDPAKWTIDEFTRDHICKNGANQNIQNDFPNSERIYKDKVRQLSRHLFERQLLNGEKVPRKWLIYSKSTGCVYCGPCLLFNGGESQFDKKEGFNDWKNSYHRVSSHENSPNHKLSVLQMKERSNVLGRIDHALTMQLDEEINYWKNILKRVVACVKALASRGLPFRGHDEKFGSIHNGNYLMSLELIAEFDPFLAKHITRYGNPGSGFTSYLSSTTCEEFIRLMGNKVLKTIIMEILTAKYFSLIIDSTPDISHVDQLTYVIRYVLPNGSPVERFLKFIPNTGHKSQQMTDAVTSTLIELGIDISNCRGQSYDNAANMSGIYNGLQTKIKEISPLADYVPCSAHSLNLVGECAAESSQEACSFFSLLQELYNFFAASTQRWELLQTHFTVKSLSTTRWSARADACKSLRESWNEIHKALVTIENDTKQKRTVICEARGIRLKLERFETALMAVFWGCLLDRINATSKKLQSVEIDITIVIELYDTLIHFVGETRENFDEFENKAIKLSFVQEYEKDFRRNRKRKLLPDETNTGENMKQKNGRENFRINTFLVVIDTLSEELKRRRDAYKLLNNKFYFITNLTNLSISEVEDKAKALQMIYSTDLEDNFTEECLHFRSHCSIKNEERKSAVSLLKWLRTEGLQTIYPNVDIALRMCVCTPASNCTGERSFSCLRRVKNYLRTTMTEQRLNDLALLNIEADFLSKLDCEDLINDFAALKCRRVL